MPQKIVSSASTLMIALLAIIRFCVALYPVMIPHPLFSESLEFDDLISSVHPLIFKSLAVPGEWQRAPRGGQHQVCGRDANRGLEAACRDDRGA